jgi:hypothetical protein
MMMMMTMMTMRTTSRSSQLQRVLDATSSNHTNHDSRNRYLFHRATSDGATGTESSSAASDSSFDAIAQTLMALRHAPTHKHTVQHITKNWPSRQLMVTVVVKLERLVMAPAEQYRQRANWRKTNMREPGVACPKVLIRTCMCTKRM